MNAAKKLKFRELLNRPGIISVPVCYDAISARIMEKVGFELIAMGGNGTMASLLGYPDIGLATATEMIGRARQISSRISIPMYCDADTGYGNLNNVRRTVEEYEAAGASGIHLEDQVMPKKCGMMKGVQLISAEEATEKIKIALKVRKDPNFVVIARTDCYRQMGADEAIRRCKMFQDAGADMVMPCGIYENRDDMLKVVRALNHVPVVCDIHARSEEFAYSDKELENFGFKIITRGQSTVTYVCKALIDYLQDYRETGEVRPYIDKYLGVDEYNNLMGAEEEDRIRDLLDE